MHIARHASLETMLSAGFNYYEIGISLERNGRAYNVRLARDPFSERDIILIESRGKRRSYYLQLADGKRLQDCQNAEETEACMERILSTIDRKFHVPGPQLEGKLRDLVQKTREEFFATAAIGEKKEV